MMGGVGPSTIPIKYSALRWYPPRRPQLICKAHVILWQLGSLG